MYYYRVRAVTDEQRVVHPDIPDDIPWVGNTDGEWYLIKTPAELPTREGCERCQPSELESVCQEIGLSSNDVLRWRVREEVNERGPVHRKVGWRRLRRPSP